MALAVRTHINEVTRCKDGAVVESFRDIGFDTANFGSYACYFYRTVSLSEPSGHFYSFGEMIWDLRDKEIRCHGTSTL